MDFFRKNKNTGLFIGFLLLGGLLHSMDDWEPHYFLITLSYCAEYLIYAGLILFWMQSVRRRLSPTWAKGYLMAAACMMLLFLIAQFTKYRIAVSPGFVRYCWYLYYVPILMIPTLFLITCLRFFKGGGTKNPTELWLLLPAGLLSASILTNDLHMQAFLPNEGILHNQGFMPNEGIEGLTGAPNTYTHGVLYYAAYAWAGCMLAAGIIVLLAACRKKGKWKKAFFPLLILLLIPPILVVYDRIPKDTLPIMYEWVEIVIFGVLGVFEACIRSRLIPSNENYPGFFSQLELPALITTRDLHAAYETKAPIDAGEEQLRASLDTPVYISPDIRLLGMTIRAGYAFRAEDESALNRMNEELRDANDILEQENELLSEEQALALEQAGIEERSHLYQKAAREVYPAQKKISAILEGAKPGTDSFRSDIENVLMLTAYVKRKANFVLVEAERGTITAGELASAIEESAHYLCYAGVHTTTDLTADRTFVLREAMAVYDCFEAVSEDLMGKTKELFVRLMDHELLMMADFEVTSEEEAEEEELPKLPLPFVKSFADGQMILRFTLEGGAL